MPSGLIFPVCSLFYCVLILCLFMLKAKLASVENKIFTALLIANFFGLVLEIICYPAAQTFDIFWFSPVILKSYLVFLIFWTLLYTTYVVYISSGKTKKESVDENVKQYKKILCVFGVLFFLCVIAVVALPIRAYNQGFDVYAYGASVDFVYAMTGGCVLITIVCSIFNFKEIRHKKYIPIFFFITIGVVLMLIQAFNPEILLITSIHTFITALMFHTIENPDMKLIKELDIAKEQAEKANLAKTDFLSNMSHEIRTPLNAVVGFSQSLTERELPDEARDDVKDIMQASESLLDIVNGILDIAKIEANKLEIVNKEYDFKEVLEELEALVRGRMGDKPIEFRTNFDGSIPRVLYGDYVRLKQIIINLLTNSIKYTKEGFIEFKVSSFVKGDYCRLIISVEDSGIGIKKENIDKLFHKFQRVDLEENISIEGTGLGLAITQKLVELMHGQIVVQSIYGQGSKFTVAVNQRVVSNPTIFDEEDVVDPTTIDFSNKKVLVVDDNKINLKVAKRLLEQYKVQATEVYSGQECLQLINTGETFDLILLDDMMPKLSGTQTLKLLRGVSGFNIPVVALTANALTGMREKYLSEGFDDYLPKPINRNELTKVISKFLAPK